MKITVETDNVFYVGWLAYVFQLPTEHLRPKPGFGAEAFDEGYKMAEETGPIASITPKDLKSGAGIMKLRAIGLLYSAFLAEKELGRNIKVSFE